MLPAGDDLTNFYFVLSLPIAILAVAASMIDWKSRSIIILMMILSAALILLAFNLNLLKAYLPEIYRWMSTFSSNPESWFLLLLFSFGLSLWNKSIPGITEEIRDQINKYSENQSRHAVEKSLVDFYKPNTKTNALRIELGSGTKFDRLQIEAENGICTRNVFVAIHNDGDGFLTSCKLLIKASNPPPKAGRIPNTFDYDFRLSAKEYKFIPIMGFIERYTGESNEFFEEIKARVTSGVTFWGNIFTFDRVPKERAIIFTLEASAEECSSVEIGYRMWIEDDRTLRIEEA
jgi:hypothetical protein